MEYILTRIQRLLCEEKLETPPRIAWITKTVQLEEGSNAYILSLISLPYHKL